MVTLELPDQPRRHAVIAKRRKWKGMTFVPYFYFTLLGDNGEPVAQSELYTAKHNVTDILERYFPTFVLVDKT